MHRIVWAVGHRFYAYPMSKRCEGAYIIVGYSLMKGGYGLNSKRVCTNQSNSPESQSRCDGRQHVQGLLGRPVDNCIGGSCGMGCASDPCLESMKCVLAAIADIVRSMSPGFSIAVEITTTDGTVYTVVFSSDNCVTRINGTTLVSNDLVISICAIAKIRVLTGGLVGSPFEAQLLAALNCLANRCCDDSCCGDSCAQDIENYLRCHRNSVAGVSLEGGLEIVRDVLIPTSINYTSVVDSVALSTTPTTALSGALLSTEATSVVSAVLPASTSVVSSITGGTASVVSGVASTPVAVSAPISSVPTTVVTAVATTPVTGLAQNLSVVPVNVVESISTGTATVLTGLGTPATISGVLTGLTGVSSVAPEAVLIPFFTSGAAGPLTVTVEGVSYPVLAGGEPMVYGGTLTAFVFPNTASFLGGITGTPTLSTITQQGTPTTATVVSSVAANLASVVGSASAGSVSGQLVDAVSTGTVGSVISPTTITAVGGVTATTELISTLGAVNSIPASSLFTTAATDVIRTAALSTTATSALASAALSVGTQTIVGSISTTPIDIAVPSGEALGGPVAAVGCGIMAVDDANGDVSVYSVCDIKAVETD